MNPDNERRPGDRDSAAAEQPAGAAGNKTPGPDMQGDDAGTPQSGNSGRGTASEGAMKQTSKTDAESGSTK